MTDRHWSRVLGLYRRLGAALGRQLSAVAPDRVGCQTTTLARLAAYRSELRELHAMGVRVLLPVQRGAMSQADFYWAACDVLGFAPVPALPCKKAATSAQEAAAFACAVYDLASPGWAPPRTIHLLGLGARNRRAAEYLGAIAGAAPGVQIQMDAVVITALAGRANGPGGKPRVLTAANDLALQLARQTTCLATVAARKYLGLVLALGGVGALS
jgi:hypothetical protein